MDFNSFQDFSDLRNDYLLIPDSIDESFTFKSRDFILEIMNDLAYEENLLIMEIAEEDVLKRFIEIVGFKEVERRWEIFECGINGSYVYSHTDFESLRNRFFNSKNNDIDSGETFNTDEDDSYALKILGINPND